MDTIPQDNTPCKQCIKPDCEKWLPATPAFFYRDKRKKDGLCSWCKECSKSYDKERAKNPRRREQSRLRARTPERRETIRAYHARPEIREIDRERSRLRSQRPDVKAKVKSYQKEYYARPEIRERENASSRIRHNRPGVRERKLLHAKEYNRRPDVQIRNKERYKAYYSRPEVKEHHRLVQQAYYSRPEVQENRRIQRKAYFSRPDVRIRRQIYSHKRDALERAALGKYTQAQIQEQLKRQRYRCYYAKCGFSKFQRSKGKYVFHIEHTFPLSRVAGTDIPANDMSYLVLACPTCNLSKNNKFPWEWPEGGRLL